MGPSIDALLIGDTPEAWIAAGFSVDDDGVCRVGSVRLRLLGDGKYVQGWSLRDIPPGDLDGLSTSVSDAPPAEPATHPNGVVAIDHVVIVSPDVDRTTAALEAAGIGARRTRDTGQYGTPMRQRFFKLGEVILELIGPKDPAGDGPTRFFGLAYTVADLAATSALLAGHIGQTKDAVQEGRRIATLRHKDYGMSVATAFMSPEPVQA
jgi:hypothetical protein